VGLERSPLAEEAPLAELPEGDARGMFMQGHVQGRGLALRECRRPVAPVAPSEMVGQGHEQRIVVQPARVLGTELVQVVAIANGRRACKAIGSPREPRHAIRHARCEIDARIRQLGRRSQFRLVKPAMPCQVGQVDKQNIAGEGGAAHVG
jgi:hypothetical protein